MYRKIFLRRSNDFLLYQLCKCIGLGKISHKVWFLIIQRNALKNRPEKMSVWIFMRILWAIKTQFLSCGKNSKKSWMKFFFRFEIMLRVLLFSISQDTIKLRNNQPIPSADGGEEQEPQPAWQGQEEVVKSQLMLCNYTYSSQLYRIQVCPLPHFPLSMSLCLIYTAPLITNKNPDASLKYDKR